MEVTMIVNAGLELRPLEDYELEIVSGAGTKKIPRRLPRATLHRAGGRLLRVASDQGPEGEAAVRDRHEGRRPVRHRRYLGELEGSRLGRVDPHVRDHHDQRQRAV